MTPVSAGCSHETPVVEGAGSGRVTMSEDAAFTDFPLEIRKRVTSYLGVTSSGIPEVSQHGSEGSEFSEGTEGSETSERSETTETSETTERKESVERYAGPFSGPR